MGKRENYQFGQLLGQGGFAEVYIAKCITTGEEVAIKMIDKERMRRQKMEERVRQEAMVHSRLKHPSIVDLKDMFEDDQYVYLVLELCHNGDVAKYFKNVKRTFSEVEARIIFDQVVAGVQYLHRNSIMHRDLTLANLMITKDMKVKIGDFGLAKKLQTPSERHVTMCGTPNFISPEVATRSNHGLSVDTWGLGILLYTLLVGKPPFDTERVQKTLTKVVMESHQFPEHLRLSFEVKDLINNLLKKNEAERIKLNDILLHPWMMLDNTLPQDSGIAMTTTNFSSNSITKPGPGPRPMAAYPVLTEYSEENEMYSYTNPTHQTRPILPSSRSTPMLSRPQTPVSDPPILAGLRSKLSSLPSAPDLRQRDSRETSMLSQCQYPALSRQGSTPCLQPMEYDMRSIRSNISDPSYSQPQHQPVQYNSHQNSLHSQTPIPFNHVSQHSSQPRPPTPTSTSLPPRLCSARLRPTRQRNKNVVANIISPNGEVCLEFIKTRRSQEEVVTEVMRISSDGDRIVLFTPGHGTLLSTKPPLSSGDDKYFSYDSLDTKYHKKYHYAARFVNLVKASTPKITIYTSEAKCYFMENGDFEAYFYTGCKMCINSGIMNIKKSTGLTQSWNVDHQSPMEFSLQASHVKNALQHCQAIQSLLEPCDQAANLPTFPIILGRKPSTSSGVGASNTGNNSLEKENRAPENVVNGMTDTIISKVTACTERQGRSVNLPGVGVATQLPDGSVRVDYNDGSSLLMRTKTEEVEFCPVSRGGQWSVYNQLTMPAFVRQKLTLMPEVIEALQRSTVGPSR